MTADQVLEKMGLTENIEISFNGDYLIPDSRVFRPVGLDHAWTYDNNDNLILETEIPEDELKGGYAPEGYFYNKYGNLKRR